MGEQAAGGEPMREVGGYRLLRVLGSGGMGTVYEAVDAEDRHVAVKLLHPAFSADDAARERLRREVATLHRVRGEHVARVLDAEADSAEAFIVTELINGQSLEESVREHGPLDAEELTELADGLATALEAIHAVGVVHRDLKPGNVMLTDDGPVVIDFGISQLADDPRLTRAGMVTGTPGYVDPEVMRGADPGHVGDWWGWAAVLVFAATGRGPFGRGPGVLLRVESGRVDTDGLAPRVAQVLRRALHPDPERRMKPASVRQALADHAAGREVTSLLSESDAAAFGAGAAAGSVAATDRLDPDDRTDVVDGSWVDDVDDFSDEDAFAESVGPLPPTIPPGAPGGTPHDAGFSHTAVMPQGMREQYPPTAAGWDLPAPSPGPAYGMAGQGEMVGFGGMPPGVDPPVPGADADGAPTAWPSWATPAPARSGLTLAWFAALALLGALYPSLVLLAAVALMIVFGSVGSAGRALRQRRMRRGKGRWDVPMATVSYPLHLVLGILLTLPGVIVAAAGAVIVWVLGAQTVPMEYLVPVAVAVALLLLWWTPSSASAREGQRSVLRRIAPPGAAAAVWVLLACGVGVTALAILLLGGGVVEWSPAPAPPTEFF
ncbi:serine/threonine-protein kinase [Ruania halotolerans]|uniref:serine/threonine-protein kinase n=1 Tax=Ruania halotolerans TaxID=2897773 RepID=UPI001E2A3AD1|nr:serine/threonine-protein kinase [Ruania halotolerans]UFU07207.1 serine/threonine protein kinase [Ruania halotolerans]